jgi:hypothetical protein
MGGAPTKDGHVSISRHHHSTPSPWTERSEVRILSPPTIHINNLRLPTLAAVLFCVGVYARSIVQAERRVDRRLIETTRQLNDLTHGLERLMWMAAPRRSQGLESEKSH